MTSTIPTPRIDRSCLQTMNSPVRSLMTELVGNSVFRVAPEREATAGRILGTFDLIYSNERRWEFCADPLTREVFVSRGAIELIWCASLAHFLFYTRLVQGKSVKEPTVIDPRGDPDVRAALDLLRWAILCQKTKDTGDDWPEGLPFPVETPPEGVMNAANELCLVTCAFILHHELAHLRSAHRADVDAAVSLAQEKEADVEATDWMFGDVELSGPVFNKRMLGASGAFVLTTAMELYGRGLNQGTHPYGHDRLFALLSRYLTDDPGVAEWVAFVVLDLHLQNSGRQLKNHAFESPRHALEAICDQIAQELRELSEEAERHLRRA